MASIKDDTLVGPTARMSEKNKRLAIDLNIAPPEEDLSNLNEERETKIAVVVDSEEKERRNTRWLAILDVGKMSLIDYEKQMKKKVDHHFGNGSTRNRISAQMDGGDEFVVPRSTRGRTVAMPNKFRDSVLEPPDFSRTGKSVGVKRKSR